MAALFLPDFYPQVFKGGSDLLAKASALPMTLLTDPALREQARSHSSNSLFNPFFLQPPSKKITFLRRFSPI
jgi:hypothetical protein